MYSGTALVREGRINEHMGRPTTLRHKFTVMHYISIRIDVAATAGCNA